MDIISHGLYGGVFFGRKRRRDFLTAFFFGVMPDLFSFGIFFVAQLFTGGLRHMSGPPDPSIIPTYVYQTYNVTHSLVVFCAVFALVWAIRGKPYLLMGGWPLHILVDIFTHSRSFFPTPFLWPISGITFNGYSWGHPIIFIPNVILIICLYVYFFYLKPRRANATEKA